MTALYRTSLVLGIIILVIVGLNTSNQGINSLTMQTREPILGWQTHGSTLSIYTLGESHSYGKQEVVSRAAQAWNQVGIYTQASLNYLQRIVKILRALLGYY